MNTTGQLLSFPRCTQSTFRAERRLAARHVSGEDDGDEERQADRDVARLTQFQQEGEVRLPEWEVGEEAGRN